MKDNDTRLSFRETIVAKLIPDEQAGKHYRASVIKLLGSVLAMSGFIFGKYVHSWYLLIVILGSIISLAVVYVEEKVRNIGKWRTIILGSTLNWIGIVIVGIGFMIYTSDTSYVIGFLLVTLCGWDIVTGLLFYKVTDRYPKEINRYTAAGLLIGLIIILELIFTGLIVYFAIIFLVILLITNIAKSYKLLQTSDSQDRTEKKLKTKQYENRSNF
ncbi:MAG: hypothetical protein PHO94_10100 [Petrimonas sp.]|nr:hypothetical protein [Petrimonas sp.]